MKTTLALAAPITDASHPEQEPAEASPSDAAAFLATLASLANFNSVTSLDAVEHSAPDIVVPHEGAVDTSSGEVTHLSYETAPLDDAPLSVLAHGERVLEAEAMAPLLFEGSPNDGEYVAPALLLPAVVDVAVATHAPTHNTRPSDASTHNALAHGTSANHALSTTPAHHALPGDATTRPFSESNNTSAVDSSGTTPQPTRPMERDGSSQTRQRMGAAPMTVSAPDLHVPPSPMPAQGETDEPGNATTNNDSLHKAQGQIEGTPPPRARTGTPVDTAPEATDAPARGVQTPVAHVPTAPQETEAARPLTKPQQSEAQRSEAQRSEATSAKHLPGVESSFQSTSPISRAGSQAGSQQDSSPRERPSGQHYSAALDAPSSHRTSDITSAPDATELAATNPERGAENGDSELLEALAPNVLDTSSPERSLAEPHLATPTPMESPSVTAQTTSEPHSPAPSRLLEHLRASYPAAEVRISEGRAGETLVSMNHPEFGAIELNLQMTAGGIDIAARVDGAIAASLLRRSETSLRKTIHRRGLSLGRLRVERNEKNPSRRPVRGIDLEA